MQWPAFRGLAKRGPAFARALGIAAAEIPADPVVLATIIELESAQSWDPSIVSPTPSQATGFLQWLPSTAVQLGMASDRATASEVVARMSPEVQLRWVPRTFHAAAGRRPIPADVDPGDLYLLIFAPAFYRAPDDAVIGEPGSDTAEWNAGYKGPDGAVTAGGVRSAIRYRVAAARKLPTFDDEAGGSTPGKSADTIGAAALLGILGAALVAKRIKR